MRNLSRLKLCFLAGTLEHGGAERQLFYILQALCQAGATPRLLSLDQGEFWEETIKALGVCVSWVGDRPSRLTRLFRVLKEVRKNPPDVLQSQHFYTNAYVGVAARLVQASGIGAMRNNGRTEVSESGILGGWANLRLPRTIAANSQIARQYAIAQGVQFRGGVSEIRSVYQEAAICVLTSDFEGTPNALLEAMSSGLPVVATKVGGVPGIVRHGQTGFLLEPDDLDGLVAALVELVKNSQLRADIGRRARAYVEENHSLDRLPAYLSGLYDLALPTRRHSTTRLVQGTSI